MSKTPFRSARSISRPMNGDVVRPGQIRPEPRPRRLRVEDPDRLRLPLQRRGLQLLVVEHHRGRLIGRKADRDTHLRRDRLQPRRGVDRIPRQHPLPQPRTRTQTHQRLAGVHPHPQPQRRAADRLQLLRALHDPQPARTARSGSSSCAAGTPNTPTTASPMNFSTTPPCASIRARAISAYADQHPVHVLRIRLLRRRREPDQIAEQHRHDLPLLRHQTAGSRSKSGGALHAELRASRILMTTRRAGRHRTSLRHHPTHV